jgi:hypothetical protein
VFDTVSAASNAGPSSRGLLEPRRVRPVALSLGPAGEADASMAAVMVVVGFDAEETVTPVGLAKADTMCLRQAGSVGYAVARGGSGVALWRGAA